jgi:hypothetical protein
VIGRRTVIGAVASCRCHCRPLLAVHTLSLPATSDSKALGRTRTGIGDLVLDRSPWDWNSCRSRG